MHRIPINQSFLLLIILLFQAATCWGEAIPIRSSEDIYVLVKQYPVEYYVDDTMQLTEQEVALKSFIPYPEKAEFLHANTNHFNLWMKFQFENTLNENVNLISTVNSPRGFNLYADDGKKLTLLNLAKPFNIAKLHLSPLSTSTFYMKWPYVLRSDWRFLPITFYSDPAQFAQQSLTYYFIIGITYGVLIGLLFYTLFVFILTFDINYLLFILIIFAMLPSSLNNDNILSSLFSTKYNRFNMLYIPIFYIVSAFVYTLFTCRVLQANIYTKRLYSIAKIYLIFAPPLFAILWLLCVNGIIHTWVVYQGISGLYALLGLLICILICVVEVFSNSYQPARYYFLGIVASSAGYLMQFLASFTLIPYNFFTMNFGRFGFTLDFMFQSVVLAAYINTIKQKEAQTQVELLEQKNKLIDIKEASLKQIKSLVRAYERFFPHRFMELLGKKSATNIYLGDQVEKEMVIVFSDIRNFTTLLEKMSPQESFNFINDYLAQAGPLIRKYNGFIDKYIGDSIMAIFDNTQDAINASLSICKVIQDQSSVNHVDSSIHIGVGIHFGPLILGTIGEIKRMDATVISDAVNTASRLESLNKLYGTTIIISEAALATLTDTSELFLRFIDSVEVKGKLKSQNIYEIYNIDEPKLIENKKMVQQDYEQAIIYYQQGKFKEAIGLFQTCQNILPKDQIIKIYIDRCEDLIKRGMSGPWNYVTHLSLKMDATFNI